MFKTAMNLTVAFTVGLAFICQASAETKSTNKNSTNKSSKYILSLEEVRALNKNERSKYFKVVAKAMVLLSKKGKRTYTFIDLILAEAKAAGSYRCIGGGVPVSSDQTNCGVSSYAGFTCANGYEICNPLIFGLKPDGQPVCYPNATTRKCYQNIITGRTTTFEHEQFNSDEVKQAYREYSAAITEICNGTAQVQEARHYRDSACHMVQRQTAVNRNRQIVNWQPTDTTVAEPSDDRTTPVEDDSDLVARTPIQRGDNPCSAPSLTSRVPLDSNGTGASTLSLPSSNGDARDCSVLGKLSSGELKIPSYLGQLVPVKMGNVTICVMPDYLSVGSDADNVRVPLGSRQAIELAREMGFILPTTAMVDKIYDDAEIKIPDQPRGPPRQATSTFFSHDATIDGQLRSTNYRPGNLVAGNKKDLVLNMSENRRKVCIYGWHKDEGGQWETSPHCAHDRDYADYSHGIRMVSQVAFVDGRPVDLRDLLTDSRYSSDLNNRGLSSNAIARFSEQETRAEEGRGESCFTNPTSAAPVIGANGRGQDN